MTDHKVSWAVRRNEHVAAFVMNVGRATCKKTACQLEIGRSTPNHAIHEAAKKIERLFADAAVFTTKLGDVQKAMENLKVLLVYHTA